MEGFQFLEKKGKLQKKFEDSPFVEPGSMMSQGNQGEQTETGVAPFFELFEGSFEGTRTQGSLRALSFFAVFLLLFTIFILMVGRTQSEPYVFGFFGFLAILGVFSVFAFAAGFLRFSVRSGQTERLSSAFLDSFPEGVLVTNSQGLVVYANRMYAELTGAESAEEVRSVARVFSVGTDVSDALFRLVRASELQQAAQEDIRLPFRLSQKEILLSSHMNRKKEEKFVESRGDFSATWYRICVRPLSILGATSESLETYTIWQVADVTEDRIQQELSFQELQWAVHFLDNAPSGFFSCDAEGRVLYVNATLADWLGYDLAQLTPGALWLEDLVQGEAVSLLHSVKGLRGEIRTQSFDVDFVMKNGQNLPVRLLHAIPFDSNGQRGESCTLVLNRSKGEDAAEALRAAQVRFARFFNNTPVAIASLDAQGRVMQTNAAFVRLFGGLDLQEDHPPRLIDLLGTQDTQALSAAINAACSGKGAVMPVDIILPSPIEEQFSQNDRNGILSLSKDLKIGGSTDEERSARFYISAVQDGDEKGEAAIVYALDTTHQRTLEKQFTQSQKMQAIGQLAGGVAHDFNNVLTAIIGFSDLLLANHRPTDPSFQDIMNIKQNANRAAGLVRQLLAFSRRQTLRPKKIMLNDLLNDLSILLDRLLGEKVRLSLEFQPDLWSVMADVNQLEQVVVNLAVNARDAMPEGGTLTIRTSNLLAAELVHYEQAPLLVPGDYVCIEVQDTGIGMSAAIMDKIFEPFFSTKEVGKGTGLGLSTVYGIIKQTGGVITPTSVPGQGTTFSIFLPRAIEDLLAKEKDSLQTPQEEPSSVARDLTGNARILLVEDEETVRSFAARALISRGYVVHQAATGTEALEIMEKTKGAIDLVVSDVVMPEMDGPSLLVTLRKKRPDLKVIFISGYAEDAFEKNLPENEKFHFLPKPFSLKGLITAIKEALGPLPSA